MFLYIYEAGRFGNHEAGECECLSAGRLFSLFFRLYCFGIDGGIKFISNV